MKNYIFLQNQSDEIEMKKNSIVYGQKSRLYQASK